MAELDVSPKRITYSFRPQAKERRGGQKNVINCAVREALANNDGDVLVQMEYTMRVSRNLFGVKKVKEVTLTGYPAKFKNFSTAK